MDSARKRERLRQFEELCRQRGLSLTVQRRVILESILERRDHPTADQVYDEVKDRIPGVSRTTVYRVLEMLVEVGVITKTCSPHAATRFDPMTHRHHHLVCLHCDKLIDLEDERLDRRVDLSDVRASAFEIQDFSIHFRGTCAACRRRLRSSRASRQGVSKRESRTPKRRKRP